MPFEHQGVIFLFKCRARAERDSSGKVGGTEEILSSGIAQIKPVRFEYRRSVLRRDIMREGGTCPVC